jgi:hypothetical protein
MSSNNISNDRIPTGLANSIIQGSDTIVKPEWIFSRETSGLLNNDYSLSRIADLVQKKSKKPFTIGDNNTLVKLLSMVSREKYLGKTFYNVWDSIAEYYANLPVATKRKIYNSDFNPNSDPKTQEEYGQFDDIKSYQNAELKKLTDNENPLRATLFPSNQNPSVLTRENRSIPDGIARNTGLHTATGQIQLYEKLLTVLQDVHSVLNPESLDESLKKIQFSNTNYQSVNLKTITIQFDTRNNNRLGTDDYTWGIQNTGFNGTRGDIYVQDMPQNLIYMKITEMEVPYTENATNYYNTLRLLIKEFSAQSITVSQFLGPTQTRNNTSPYHFEFQVKSINRNRAIIVPVQPLYIFRRPITQMDRVTLLWYNPYEPIRFDTDQLDFVATYGGATTVFNSPTPHNLTTGDLVYINNASTGSLSLDNILNNTNGLPVTVLSTTSISVSVNSATATVLSQNGVTIYFGSKRIFFNIEFKCLDFL